jgi:hypothetical protein
MKTMLMCAFTVALLASSAAPYKAVARNQNELMILARTAWNSNPPVAEVKSHKIARITIHHTAPLQKPEPSLVERM